MWDQIGNKLITRAQDFPEDKYDVQLQKDQRTLAQNLLHVAGVDCELMLSISGSNIGPDFGKNKHNPSRDVYKTKADVVKLMQQAIADGANLIKQQGDAGLDKITKYAWGNRLVHNSYTWMWAIEHGGEHYASLWSTVARTTWCRRTRGGNAVIGAAGSRLAIPSSWLTLRNGLPLLVDDFASVGARLGMRRRTVYLKDEGKSLPVSAPDQVAIFGGLNGLRGGTVLISFPRKYGSHRRRGRSPARMSGGLSHE